MVLCAVFIFLFFCSFPFQLFYVCVVFYGPWLHQIKFSFIHYHYTLTKADLLVTSR